MTTGSTSHRGSERVEIAEGRDPADLCSLPEDGLEARLAWVQREILPHRVGSERLRDGLALEVSAQPGVAARLDRLVALEQECCSGIVFEHLPSAVPGRRRLEIHGVDPDAALFRQLGAGSLPAPVASGVAADGGNGLRLLKSAGFGVLASLFVCCILPVGAAALLGAAAPPLAGLDAPAPIAAGALLAGGGTWWWLGRGRGAKTDRAAQASGDCGC